MRLTLRTLLAYLDDMLEPSQAAVIGQKVAESETARDLIARIRQVTRRRRLTIPPATGPGARLDANVIAEYLDNVLPGDQLGEVEETCLSSDVHLAEVSACHQILTLVLGEPALIPPTARMRMYRLIQGAESLPDRKVPPSPVGQGALEGVTAGHDDADEALLLGLPVYERSDKWMRWIVPIIAGCLVVAAGSAILMALTSTPSGLAPLRNGPVEAAQLTPIPELKPEPGPRLVENKVKQVDQRVEAPKKPAETVKQPNTEIKNEPPREKAEAKNTPPVETEVPPAKPQPPSTERRALGKAFWNSSPASILLERSSDAGAWQRVAQKDPIYSNDYVVTLPGYRSEIRLDNGLALQLWSNLPQISRVPILESAVVLHAAPDADLDFTLDHGRVVIVNPKESARVRLRFRKEVCELDFLDAKTELGVDLLGICPPYMPEPRKDPEIRVRFYALHGRTRLSANSQTYLLTAPSAFDWDNTYGYVSRPADLPRPPDWWNPKPPALNRDLSFALDSHSRRLQSRDRVEVAFSEGVREPDLSMRVLAVRFLGAMDDPAKLLDCLADERHTDVRVMAIEELRHLLGLHAQNDEKCRTLLKQKNYSDAQADTVLQLLHGFPLEQWTTPALKSTVVEYLTSDKLAIRQLAHTLLLSFVPEGQRIRYDAAATADQRQRGYREWQRLVAGSKPPTRSSRSK
jgi:hypothetical protein